MEGDKLNTAAEVSDGGTRSPVLIKFSCFFAVDVAGVLQRKPKKRN